MIEFRSVTLTYPGAARPTLVDVDLRIDEGELCLVVGPTGSGKSTFLGCINGLVPHFTGGTLAGSVLLDGRSTKDQPPRELAGTVGVVGQDPLTGFVTDTVEEELAYGMEQLAIEPSVMRKRVEETLDLLGIAGLRARSLRTLSGGQQQRVAIGSVLTAHPRVLVLDEPTSALDPTAAEEVLAAVTRLVHDLGITVVMAEHRLERVIQYADVIAYLPGDGRVEVGPPAEIMARSTIAPPVVELGRLAGWSPLPMSVRDARRLAGPLRERLSGLPVPPHRPVPATTPPGSGAGPRQGEVLRGNQVSVTFGSLRALKSVDVSLQRGEIIALMGRNGSGKSTLLWALQGSGPRHGGTVSVFDDEGMPLDPATLSPGRARELVGLVPQTPSDLLYLASVAQECAQADDDARAPVGTCAQLLARLAVGIDPQAHPRDLSEGQRLALVLAIQLTASPAVVLLDEPTRGLDYRAKAALSEVLAELAAQGRAVVVATHDVEFVANTASRVVVLAAGEVVADGPTAAVVVASPAFAPQVAKILAPLEYLNVTQVRTALDRAEERR